MVGDTARFYRDCRATSVALALQHLERGAETDQREEDEGCRFTRNSPRIALPNRCESHHVHVPGDWVRERDEPETPRGNGSIG